jgi:hypothetical protein
MGERKQIRPGRVEVGLRLSFLFDISRVFVLL